MALAKRIIPCLDVDHGKVVKGRSFKDLRYAGDPVALARKYSEEGADELVFLDITASPEKRKILREMVSEVAKEIDIPFTVGGGVKSEGDARLILNSGADKVSVNTAAVEEPELITRLAAEFGEQCVVVAIDAKKQTNSASHRWTVFTYGARVDTGLDAIQWAKRAEGLGAGEVLLTSIDMDGKVGGYDLQLTRSVCESVNVPVIASGGCGALEHFYEAFEEGKADAALAASVFHYGKFTVMEVKRYLSSMGIVVRL